MPFDASGNFSRSYNFTQDRDNGIRILASRVDGEFDNFAQGMNQVFFRNGLVSMSGDLNLGLNRIVGIGDGTVNNPAVKWSSDPLSGLYLAAYGKPAIATGGVKVAEFTAFGAAIFGYTAFGDANFKNYMNGNNAVTLFDTGDYSAYDRVNDAFSTYINNTVKTVVANTGFTVSGDVSVSGVHSVGGNTITQGKTFFGDNNFASYTTNAGDNAVSLYAPDDFISYSRSGDQFSFSIAQNAKLQINANRVLSSVPVYLDNNFFIYTSAGNPVINYGANTYVTFDRVNLLYNWVINGTSVMRLDRYGNLRINGTLTQNVTN